MKTRCRGIAGTIGSVGTAARTGSATAARPARSVRHNQPMSRPNDQVSDPSARPTATNPTVGGNRWAVATTRTIPCTAATTLRENRAGSAAVSHGNANDAATNAYRNAPIATVHQPKSPATNTLSTRIRKASTSMSKRAPSAEVEPVRRATWPSTPSSASATPTRVTSSADGIG